MQRVQSASPIDRLAEFFAEHPRSLFLIQIVPPLVFVFFFVFVPVASIFVWSFWLVEAGRLVPAFTLEAYAVLFGIGHSDFRLVIFLRTLRVAAMQVGLAAVIGFAIAYYVGIKLRDNKLALPLLLLFAIPFLTSYMMRTLSWWMVLQTNGLINFLYTGTASLLGFEVAPMSLLFNEFAVHLGLLSTYLPFMIFPVWLAMSRIDMTVLAASADLGARPFQTLFRVVIPLALPGILIGAVFVFVGVLGDNVVPALLGGPGGSLIGNLVDASVRGRQFNLAGAISSIILLIAFVLILVWEKLFGLKRIGEI